MSVSDEEVEEPDPELQRLIRQAVMRGYRKGRAVATRDAFVRGMVDGYQVGKSGLDLGLHIPEGDEGRSSHGSLLKGLTSDAEPDPSRTAKRWAHCFHEAGHAAGVAIAEGITGRWLDHLAISPDDPARTGYCFVLGKSDEWQRRIDARERDLLEAESVLWLAGEAAESLGGHERHAATVATTDRTQARELACFLCEPDAGDEAIQREYDRLFESTKELLRTPAVWAGVERLAKVLFRESTVDGERASELLDAPSFLKAWGQAEEDKHPRNHGKFASKPGADGKPESGTKTPPKKPGFLSRLLGRSGGA